MPPQVGQMLGVRTLDDERRPRACYKQYDTSWIGKECDRYAYNVTRSYSVGYKWRLMIPSLL